MSAAKEIDVETALRAAATTAHWPATPDLHARVMARIEAGAAGNRPEAIERRPRRRLVPALALALIALLALAGIAGALGFRLPGLDIVIVDRLSPASSGLDRGSPVPPAGAGLDLGSPVPLAEARSIDDPRVLLPAGLPEPDVAYVLGGGLRRIVTLAWRAEPGQPTIPASDLALSLMAVPGGTDDSLLKKVVARSTSIESVTVGDERGWWISGAPHEIFVARPDGDVDMVTSALAGDTLVFARDGTLYRLESALGRDATIAIAKGLR